jgi:hypothetical protein
MDITFYHRHFTRDDDGEAVELTLTETKHEGDAIELTVWMIAEGTTEPSDGATFTNPDGSYIVDYGAGIELEPSALIENDEGNDLLLVAALLTHYRATGQRPVIL